jgi:membrane associated rhomboid family serine protease
MPIEYNAVPLRQKPVVTWTLAVIIAAVSIIAFLNLEQVVTKFGLIPSRFTRDFGFTFISSFFLHAGLLHLLGNLYFLLVFGDNTEDILGRKKYLLLIILSALVGDIAHILSSPHSAVPSIGASGGISGILAYYCLRFPKARVGLFLWFCWIRIPVVLMFVFWVLIQILYAYLQKYGLSNIAAFAHLGGAFVGIFFWLISRRSVFISPEPDEFINNC